MMKFTHTVEELFSESTGTSRGVVKVKENSYGEVYALIGRRWCCARRREDGTLVEVWK